jgi:hypothetical protein
MNCFSQEDTGRRGSRPILASDGEHLDTRMLAKFVNFDPQSDDCSRHLDCDAHAWSMRKFSVGHPETGRPPTFPFMPASVPAPMAWPLSPIKAYTDECLRRRRLRSAPLRKHGLPI